MGGDVMPGYNILRGVFMARNGLGDAELVMVANTRKNPRRIRIDDSEGEGFLSPAGIIPIAENCLKEFLVMYVSVFNNVTMDTIGKNCTVLWDCHFVLLSTLSVIPGLPLDEGVKCLLQGRQNLTRFALYVCHGALTDTGMAYIGEYGARQKWILQGCTREIDVGFTRMASGCHSLERLEMRDFPITEAGLTAVAVALQKNLKYLRIWGCDVTHGGGRLLSRPCPLWIVESAPSLQVIIAYSSLAGCRRDHPPEMCLLDGGDEKSVKDNGSL